MQQELRISYVEYDSRISSSNKIVGFVLQLDSNCLPEQASFYVTSFDSIEQMFLTSKKALMDISTWYNKGNQCTTILFSFVQHR